MRLRVYACAVFAHEISALAPDCPNQLNITYLRQRYHDEPVRLREALQAEITRLDSSGEPYDAVALCYGLCGHGTAGIISQRYPVVHPISHDCIALFLGDAARYRAYFDAHPGTYWYTPGWMECTVPPGPDYLPHWREKYFQEYGPEAGAHLLASTTQWLSQYHRAAYIQWPDAKIPDRSAQAAGCAAHLGWEIDILKGSDGFLKKLLWGDWSDASRFLIVPAGKTARATGDDRVLVCAEPPDGMSGHE